jgi:hypothetical protein
MSRHTLRDDDKFEVVVGWDPPLATYFLQVFDKGKASGDDEGLIVWKGVPPESIRDLHKLKTLTTEWADLEDGMVHILAAERDES